MKIVCSSIRQFLSESCTINVYCIRNVYSVLGVGQEDVGIKDLFVDLSHFYYRIDKVGDYICISNIEYLFAGICRVIIPELSHTQLGQ